MTDLIGSCCRLVAGAHVEWRSNMTTDRPTVYFANHSSHLDFVVIWAALPPTARADVRPVARRDYWDAGAIRRYVAAHVFRAVLVERASNGPASPDTARQTVERMAEALGTTGGLIVFPEGTRSRTGEVGPFKSGLYHLSRLRPDAALIPVHLENLNRILPRGELLPVPMLSRVIFGAPLQTRQDEDKGAFLMRARRSLIELGRAS